jgi:hypothetical protein
MLNFLLNVYSMVSQADLIQSVRHFLDLKTQIYLDIIQKLFIKYLKYSQTGGE